MSRAMPRLGRLGVLAPAALSACMDASVLAVPAAGAIVSTVLKELSKAFMLKKWFHGTMSAKEAEELMMEKGKNGSFLVRESKTQPGEFVLTVRVRGRVSHVIIRKQHDKYEIGSGEQFDDLVGLIEHLRSFPLVETSGDVLRLLQPLSGARLRACSRRKHSAPQEMEEKMSDTESSFEDEFQSLQLADCRTAFSTEEGSRPENSGKNRYRNVLPYDQTRVVVRGEGVQGYINASYIRGARAWTSCSSVNSSSDSLASLHSINLRKESAITTPIVSKSLSEDTLKEVKKYIELDKMNGNFVKEKMYIATQGCLANTKHDFWNMLWQEDVRIIVMITKEIERGKKKCERYWPLLGKEETHGGLLIKSVSEDYHEQYLVREFVVTDHKNNYKTIYQYQYTGWPDHGIPSETDGVLAFIAGINTRISIIMNSKQKPFQNVICVHCSAGVGRTGTFIVLDMLIDKIKSNGPSCELDVPGTVAVVRAQRGGMVQNKAQYRFIHSAVDDYLHSIGRKKQANRVYSFGA